MVELRTARWLDSPMAVGSVKCLVWVTFARRNRRLLQGFFRSRLDPENRAHGLVHACAEHEGW